ncbi:MAG: SAM-dependent methyltransferase [Corynebacterium sp.]|nr:SAM-dependent methyltransferase [Corynebacterium sp.]
MLSPEDVRFITSNKDRIDEAFRACDLNDRLGTMATLNREFGESARAVAELFYARASAVGKYPDPESMVLCTDSAQQATPWIIASHRAERIARYCASTPSITRVQDITCSVGTEILALQAHYGEHGGSGPLLIGSDIDAGRLAMAKANGLRCILQMDALHPAVHIAAGNEPHTVIIADPARRAGGKRIVAPEDLMPPLPDVVETYAGQLLVIKCAPGLDYSEWQGIVSIASVDGSVKEACLYSSHFAKSPGQVREAVVFRGGQLHDFIDSTEPELNQTDTRPPGRYIVEPDGAVIRAGLVAHWAARHDLWFLDPHIAFLSGDSIPAGHSGWEVISQVPIKKLKAEVKAQGFSSVEILVRGANYDPDQLRKKLALGKKGKKGATQGAIIIARIGDTAQAFVCSAREFAEK